MFNMQEYNESSNRDKLGMLIKTLRQATGIPIQTIVRYFYDMVTVDMLYLNCLNISYNSLYPINLVVIQKGPH